MDLSGYQRRLEKALQAEGGGPGLSSRFIHPLPPSLLELIHKQTI